MSRIISWILDKLPMDLLPTLFSINLRDLVKIAIKNALLIQFKAGNDVFWSILRLQITFAGHHLPDVLRIHGRNPPPKPQHQWRHPQIKKDEDFCPSIFWIAWIPMGRATPQHGPTPGSSCFLTWKLGRCVFMIFGSRTTMFCHGKHKIESCQLGGGFNPY